MIIVDAHQDIAYNYLTNQRSYLDSALKIREQERGRGRPPATIGLPDAILGRVAIVFATIFAEPRRSGLSDSVENTYATAQEAYELGLQHIDYYHRLADESGKIRLIQAKADLDGVLATWEDGTEIGDHQQGLVILMEGADPIIEPKQFEEWYERGVRIVGTAWRGTRYSGGTGEPGGLTDLGRELLGIMEDYNVILDCSHMAEQAFYEALDRFDGAIIASHSNPRKFRTSDRHLSDDMIRHLAERDGVMGVVLYNAFLSNEWSKTSKKSDITLTRVIEIIDYVCQLTGSSEHVGIGSDFDGGFGANQIPEELNTVTDLLLIGDGLRERGYSDQDIDAILGGNMLRKLRQIMR